MKDLGKFIDSTGKIKTWPSKIDMKLEVLKYLSDKFEYNHFYREKEINIIIESNHTFCDYFLLRRGLIENNLLTRTRDGARYWRPDSNINEQKIMISKVLEINYDIGSIINIIKIKNVVGSSCFHILTGKGEFIFKNVEDNGMNHPSNEAKIHEILESENIPVSKFSSTKSGEYVLNLNSNICHLQSYIQGEIYNAHTSPKWLVDESAVMLGKIQKAMEKIPKLPIGMGDEYFKSMSPEKSVLCYLETLKIAETKNDIAIIEDIKYRISLLNVIKKIDIQTNELTCKNTHGDYSINQIICKKDSVNAVIDFTSACVHPICWEVLRSYSLADYECANGNINTENLKGYIASFLKYGELNSYDLKVMPYLYFYQLLFPNYYNQYYLSNNSNKQLLLDNACFSTRLCKWFELNISTLSDELIKGF